MIGREADKVPGTRLKLGQARIVLAPCCRIDIRHSDQVIEAVESEHTLVGVPFKFIQTRPQAWQLR